MSMPPISDRDATEPMSVRDWLCASVLLTPVLLVGILGFFVLRACGSAICLPLQDSKGNPIPCSFDKDGFAVYGTRP